MRAFLQDLYDRVPFSIDQVTSRADWKRWREETSAALKRALGLERFPPRSPLKPRFLETIDRGDFLLEKVVFETRPGFLMTANLYRPKEVEGKVPAVLCVHGHTMKGKASEAMQARATNYARAGWLALTVDATGHGERVPIGHRRTFSIVTVGLTLEGVQVWDNIRCLEDTEIAISLAAPDGLGMYLEKLRMLPIVHHFIPGIIVITIGDMAAIAERIPIFTYAIDEFVLKAAVLEHVT